MAFLSKKEFAGLCGKETKWLSNYITRKKVVMSGEFIDDTLAQNIDFLKKWQSKQAAPAPIVKTEAPAIKPAEHVEVPAPDIQTGTSDYENMEWAEIELKNKQLDAHKKDKDIELAQMKIEKMQGMLMPTELVKSVFAQHSASITTSFKHGAEALLGEISKLKELTRNEYAELNGKLIVIINKAVNDAVGATTKNIKAIVAEYSEKKAVGERS